MIVIGSDHGGLELKNVIIRHLMKRDIKLYDAGTDTNDSVDYPLFAEKVALLVATGEADLGILICGTGIGMSIAANKVPGVRAALVTDIFMAQMAKEHNNANILVLGGRVIDPETGCKLVDTWLDARFEEGRHSKRIEMIDEIEKKYLKQG